MSPDDRARELERRLHQTGHVEDRFRLVLERERLGAEEGSPLEVESVTPGPSGVTVRIRNNTSKRLYFVGWYEPPEGDPVWLCHPESSMSVGPAGLLASGPHRCGGEASRFSFRVIRRDP